MASPPSLSEEALVGALQALQLYAIELSREASQRRQQHIYRIINVGFEKLLERAASEEIRIRLQELWVQTVEHKPYELAERLHAPFAIFLATAPPNPHGRVIPEIHWELTRPVGTPNLVSIQGGKQ